MIVFGIDPGLSGGLAVVAAVSGISHVKKMPTLPSGSKSKRVLDENAIKEWFGRSVSCQAVIERASAMPKQGVSSVFTFGTGWGLIRGILVGLGIPYTVVNPKEWQKEMLQGVPKSDTKAASLIVAKRLFPQLAEQIGKHHGMSDALLIAEWGRRKLKTGD
jgi:crossover junction endodeoxyribonuclease RuvC